MFIIAICEDEPYMLEELRKQVETYMNSEQLPASI